MRDSTLRRRAAPCTSLTKKTTTGGYAVFEQASMQEQKKNAMYLYFRKTDGFWCIGPQVGGKDYVLYME